MADYEQDWEVIPCYYRRQTDLFERFLTKEELPEAAAAYQEYLETVLERHD